MIVNNNTDYPYLIGQFGHTVYYYYRRLWDTYGRRTVMKTCKQNGISRRRRDIYPCATRTKIRPRHRRHGQTWTPHSFVGMTVMYNAEHRCFWNRSTVPDALVRGCTRTAKSLGGGRRRAHQTAVRLGADLVAMSLVDGYFGETPRGRPARLT